MKAPTIIIILFTVVFSFFVFIMRNNDAILQPQRKSLKREVLHISVYSISDEHYYENLMSFPCHIPKQGI